MSSSRETILSRIHTALSDNPGPETLPAMPQLWPQNDLSVEKMSEMFETAITAVAGEIFHCSTMEEAVAEGKKLLQQYDVKKLGVVSRPWLNQITEKWSDFEKIFAPDSADAVSPENLAKLDAGVIQGEYLLTDTGSCVIASPTAFDRLLSYIPPICLVFAKKESLRANLQAAWPEISSRVQNPDDPVGTLNRSGEFLIVTGPSRTADIEKVLILGVHGPKQLVVFIVG